MTNDNNVKCALHPTREHARERCTPMGFTAQLDKNLILFVKELENGNQ